MVLDHSMIDKETYAFTCGYCQYNFKQEVGTYMGNLEATQTGNAHKCSSQVICPHCNNFLKTNSGKKQKTFLKK